MTATNTVEVSSIRVSKRYREDMGDLVALAKSIEAVGLLQPLVVTPDLQLVAGARRLEAVKELGWEKVPVCVAENLNDALAALRAERDENTCRKDFTPSEAVAIGKALEELERSKAKARMKEGGKAGGRGRPAKGETGSGKFPDPVADAGQTRDKVAEVVGMSGRTYYKAKEVAEAAAAEPEKFGDLGQEMDRTGKVDSAHKKLKERGGTRAARKPKGKKAKKAPDALSGVRRAARALSQLERDGQITWGIRMELDRLPVEEQLRLIDAGPAVMAAKAKDLGWLRSLTHSYDDSSHFDIGADVSAEARQEGLRLLRVRVDMLQRHIDIARGRIAALQAKLPAQDPCEQE
jgi:ParB family chromosome partitioning protein